jgi:ribonuclease P protein component
MRSSADFTVVVRRGMRVRRGSLVLHQLEALEDRSGAPRLDPLVGLVVGKSVGNSVVRHRVARRLRAQLSARVAVLPPTSATVVRALPEAALADSAQLGRDLDSALGKLARSSALGAAR